MTSALTKTSPFASPALPPLENGDQLTRDEFERRYATLPHIKKAELIEGCVYMSSLVRMTQHGDPHARIMAWLGIYWAATPGVQAGDNPTVRLDADNEVQPEGELGTGNREQGTQNQKQAIRILCHINETVEKLRWRR